MGWLLWQRVSDTEWLPAHGFLTTFGHGALVWGFCTFFAAFVIAVGVAGMRAGKRQYGAVLLWGLAVWPLKLITALPHLYPPGSSLWSVLCLAALPPGIWFLLHGAFRVVPILLRDSRASSREKPPPAGTPRAGV